MACSLHCYWHLEPWSWACVQNYFPGRQDAHFLFHFLAGCLMAGGPPAWLIMFRSNPFSREGASPFIDFRASPACFYFVAHKLCNLVLSSCTSHSLASDLRQDVQSPRPAIKSCASARGVCFDGRIRIGIGIGIRSGINQIIPFGPGRPTFRPGCWSSGGGC